MGPEQVVQTRSSMFSGATELRRVVEVEVDLFPGWVARRRRRERGRTHAEMVEDACTMAGSVIVACPFIFRAHAGQRRTSNPNVRFLITSHATYIVAEDVARDALVEVLHAYRGVSRPFSLLYPRGVTRSRAVRAMIDFILEMEGLSRAGGAGRDRREDSHVGD